MAHPIDIAVGKRLRQLRLIRKITQTDLGERLGVTFQQVQKYEKGTNRISASKLWLLSQELKISIGYFFQDMKGKEVQTLPKLSAAAFELATLFDANPHETVQRRLLQLFRAVNAAGEDTT